MDYITLSVCESRRPVYSWLSLPTFKTTTLITRVCITPYSVLTVTFSTYLSTATTAKSTIVHNVLVASMHRSCKVRIAICGFCQMP